MGKPIRAGESQIVQAHLLPTPAKLFGPAEEALDLDRTRTIAFHRAAEVAEAQVELCAGNKQGREHALPHKRFEA